MKSIKIFFLQLKEIIDEKCNNLIFFSQFLKKLIYHQLFLLIYFIENEFINLPKFFIQQQKLIENVKVTLPKQGQFKDDRKCQSNSAKVRLIQR
ncbi:unnamed protein product [Paramecium primaurelia]|uniref:Uncharacterized protein n=1 Tax=Paramecium primaurelia TaxID=5886 RepID=A0A8S1LH09_PARPR|nr:unnamed protein product [Paramecium primaurelia]